jgi:flagellar basal-body rod protein FlgC
MSDTMEVLASGLSIARLRVNLLAANLANAQTTRTPEGGPYKRKDVVQSAVATMVSGGLEGRDINLKKPVALAVVEDQGEPRKVFEPGHPDANPEGYVSYPNINIVQTMTDLMTATRLYQANIAAIETYRDMKRDALRIGQVA